MSRRQSTGVFAALCFAVISPLLWMGARVFLYNLPDLVSQASTVPGWLVERDFAVYDDTDNEALRRGLCAHDPIYVRPKQDGSAVMTCGRPIGTGPVLLFTARSLDQAGVTGLMRATN